MFIVDGKLLNLSNGGTTKLEKEVYADLQKIRERKDFVIIKDPKPYRYSDEKEKLEKQAIGFKMHCTSKGEDGISHRWIYTTREPVETKAGGLRYKPNPMVIIDFLQLDPTTETEKVYFLTKVLTVSRYGLVVEDKEQEAKKQLVKDQDKLAVEFYIKNPKSPKTLDELRFLAVGWGLSKAEDMPENLFRVEFFNRVQQLNDKYLTTGRGYKEFLKEIENFGEDVKLRTYVYKAIREKIIIWDSEKLKFYWTGEDKRTICVVPPMKVSKKEEYLLSHLLQDNDDKSILMNSIEGAVDDLPVIDIEDLKNIGHVMTLRKKIKELMGMEFEPGTGKEDMIAAVEQKINA